jgi:hypothetical protein
MLKERQQVCTWYDFWHEMFNDERCVSKKIGLVCHAIWFKGAHKVINHCFRHLWPMSEQGRKDIVPPFTTRNAVEAVTYGMSAPNLGEWAIASHSRVLIPSGY